MKKVLVLIIGLFLVTYAGISITSGYLSTHIYYFEMLKVFQNWGLVVLGLISALIPSFVIFFTRKPSLKKFIVGVPGGLYLFILGYIPLVGGSVLGLGFLKLLVNCIVMLSLIGGFITIVTVLGGVIKEKLLKLSTETFIDICLDFGVGLVTTLIVLYFLALLNILYPLVTWILVAIGIWMVKKKGSSIKKYRNIVRDLLQEWYGLISDFRSGSFYHQLGVIVLSLVIVLGFWYLYNGYLLSYMPYSTAWDANHAYMFYPKMWALNNGVYWSETAMAVMPHLWDMFITFWFSLFKPFGGLLDIASDTIALVMNFFSGVFVLVLGSALVHLIINYVKTVAEDKDSNDGILLGFGILLLLVWLTSGMGAFLVFVDNKTDLGMLTLLLLAMLSGIVFLKKTLKKEHIDSTKVKRYAGISGILFAAAVLSKPTAMFDVLNFGIFSRGLWFGVIGVIGIIVAVIGLLATMQIRSMKSYLGESTGKNLLLGGGIIWLLGLGYAFLRKNKNRLILLLVRIGAFIATLCLVRIPFLVTYNLVYDHSDTPGKFVERLLFSQSGGQNLSSSTCSLSNEGMSNVEQLYIGQPERASGNSYDEDVGRYVGYGWKGGSLDARKANTPYTNLLISKLIGDGCYGLGIAKILCNHKQSIDDLSINGLNQLLSELPSDSNEYAIVSGIISSLSTNTSLSKEDQERVYAQELRALRNVMESDTVFIETIQGEQYTYIPNKFLNFLNVTYNWSLQNESSYYTDIGMVWLLLLLLTVFGLVYGIVARHKILTVVTGTTLFSWITRHMIAGGIVWYNLGMIVWSIISFVVLLYYLIRGSTKKGGYQGLQIGLILVLFLIFLVQLVLNMIRIAGHGSKAGGGFLYYKTNWGRTLKIDDRMQHNVTLNGRYTQEDIFNEQFRHYRPLLEEANNRKDGEGVWIAGTYARYFIENQNNVKYDQFISWIQPYFFDGNACRSYLRLKDNNIKYLAIDPNIGTVVQGDGNRSLYDRFFGRVNESNGDITSYGAITMFSKMTNEGLLRLVSTNNISAKYSFILPDSTFSSIPQSSMELFKARMVVPRYTARNPSTNKFIPIIYDLADQRLEQGVFIEDIADIFGYKIDTNKLVKIINSGVLSAENIRNMTQDERKAMEQFIVFSNLKEKNKEEYVKQMQQLIANSIYSPNQIIILELVE